MKPAVDEMKQRVNEMPADQWFSMDDIVNEHNPGLWMHLCSMRATRHRRADGCLFVSDQERLNFMWQSQKWRVQG